MNCYNGESFLDKSLKSILNQTYPNWELIFFDNLSTDNSKNIFDNYNDKRFFYYCPKHHIPLTKARNEAVKKCIGEFIAFLDVDDWWEDDKLIKQIKLFADPEVALVYGNFMVNNFTNKIAIYGDPPKKIYPNKKKIMYDYPLPSGFLLSKLLDNYKIGMMTIIFRKKIVNNLEYIFNEQVATIQDFDLCIRIATKHKIIAINSILAHKRLHFTNNYNKDKKNVINEMETLLNIYKKEKNNFKLTDLVNFQNNIIYLKFINLLRNHNYLKAIYFFLKLNYKNKLKFFKLLTTKFL